MSLPHISLNKVLISSIVLLVGIAVLFANETSASEEFVITDSLKSFFGVLLERRSPLTQPFAKSFASTTFVISQFDGGGGGSTGTYLNDYIEIKNRSSSSQSLNG